jgi:hypothetical protein
MGMTVILQEGARLQFHGELVEVVYVEAARVAIRDARNGWRTVSLTEFLASARGEQPEEEDPGPSLGVRARRPVGYRAAGGGRAGSARPRAPHRLPFRLCRVGGAGRAASRVSPDTASHPAAAGEGRRAGRRGPDDPPLGRRLRACGRGGPGRPTDDCQVPASFVRVRDRGRPVVQQAVQLVLELAR